MKEMTTPSATTIIKEPSRPSYDSYFIDNSCWNVENILFYFQI
jgi:hypothetical protein